MFNHPEHNQLYCTNCGHQSSDQVSFCGQCGNSFDTSHTSTAASAEKPARPDQVPWRSGQVILGIVSVAVIALLVSQVIVATVGIEKPAAVALLTSLTLGIVILAVVGGVGLLPSRTSPVLLGIRPPALPTLRVVLLTLAALAVSLGATAVYTALVRIGGIEFLEPPEIPQGIVFSGAGVVFSFLALALWTPITEEIFFRGFVFGGLRSRLGDTRAMMVSALIFSAFHISPGVLIPIFITGLLLAWLYQRTGSIWPSIAAHAGQNAAALAFTMVGV